VFAVSATLTVVKPWARVVVAVLTLSAITVWLLLPSNKARRAAERTRQSLRNEGFKVDLADFDLSTPAGLGSNNGWLMLAADASRNMFSLRLMRPVSSNSAMVTWSQENPAEGLVDNYFWPELRRTVAERSATLDHACEAVISAPFRFKTVLATNGELAPDVVRARLLASAMAARTILELHDQHHALAWTNLLALTRLVTAWQAEPMEISHSIRFRWVLTAQRVTWEALQSRDWTDDELASLQREWESANFFNGLPETAALARAGTVEYCAFQRRQTPPPGPTLREFVSDLVNSPHRAWSEATSGWRNARYRNCESYEDEMAWLRYFRDCELDYRRALSAKSWLELQALPSATNSHPAGASNFVLGIEAARVGPGGAGFQRQGTTLLARAAEAEARRRLIVTATALEPFHLANHCYPDSLARLVPNFLKTPPKDYVDGQPLRYRRTNDDRFLLYSIGLDGIDDNGQLLASGNSSTVGGGFGRFEGPDLVWPIAASSADVRAYAQAAQNKRTLAPAQIMTPEGRPFRRYGINR
jgi:hypothetical protein